ARDEPPTPKGNAPQFGLASAVEKDGKVTIEVFELREVMGMKMPKGGDAFIEKRNWLTLTTGTLGKDIRAYRPDGKQAEPREVVNALAKPRGVAYFRGYDKEKPVQPDPFYLGLLRGGSVPHSRTAKVEFRQRHVLQRRQIGNSSVVEGEAP